MAKKVRSRPEETEESKFEFPVFDERGFIRHELELTFGMVFGVLFAVVAGLLSGTVSVWGGSGLPVLAPIGVGLLVIIFSPFLVQRLRRESADYTRGDWAGIIALEVFGWLGIWFLVAGLAG